MCRSPLRPIRVDSRPNYSRQQRTSLSAELLRRRQPPLVAGRFNQHAEMNYLVTGQLQPAAEACAAIYTIRQARGTFTGVPKMV